MQETRTTEHTSEELRYVQLALMQALVFRVKENIIIALVSTLIAVLILYPLLSDKRAIWPGLIGLGLWFLLRTGTEMYLAFRAWTQLNTEIKQAQAYEDSNNRS